MVYYTVSTLFPAKETYSDAAILPDDAILERQEREEEEGEKASVGKVSVQEAAGDEAYCA